MLKVDILLKSNNQHLTSLRNQLPIVINKRLTLRSRERKTLYL